MNPMTAFMALSSIIGAFHLLGIGSGAEPPATTRFMKMNNLEMGYFIQSRTKYLTISLLLVSSAYASAVFSPLHLISVFFLCVALASPSLLKHRVKSKIIEYVVMAITTPISLVIFLTMCSH